MIKSVQISQAPAPGKFPGLPLSSSPASCKWLSVDKTALWVCLLMGRNTAGMSPQLSGPGVRLRATYSFQAQELLPGQPLPLTTSLNLTPQPPQHPLQACRLSKATSDVLSPLSLAISDPQGTWRFTTNRIYPGNIILCPWSSIFSWSVLLHQKTPTHPPKPSAKLRTIDHAY